jgi:hypothetical protein
MCPACIESAAVVVAGAASTGGFLAVCIARFRRLFRVSRLRQPLQRAIIPVKPDEKQKAFEQAHTCS